MLQHRYDEYRKRAKEAQDQADKALQEVNRAKWLRIAASWLAMIPGQQDASESLLDGKPVTDRTLSQLEKGLDADV